MTSSTTSMMTSTSTWSTTPPLSGTADSFASEIRHQLSLFEHNASMLQDGEAVQAFFRLVNKVANGKEILHDILLNQYKLDVDDVTLTASKNHSALDTDYLVYYDQDVTDADTSAAVVAQCANSNGITAEQALIAHTFRLWVEAGLQGVVSLIGIVCNSVALLVLLRATWSSNQSSSSSSRRLQSVFNSMLSFLLLLHTLYIATTVTLVIRSWRPSYLLDFLFVHLLYPLKPMLLHAATFLTVVMARERYKAIRHPLEYRKTTAGASPWCTSLRYVLPSVLAATVCVSPLYFEVAQKAEVKQRIIENEGNIVVTNVTSYQLRVTNFRLNSHYMMWYKNMGTFVVTILLPLIFLAFWNWNTHAVILRRQRMKNRPQSTMSRNNSVVGGVGGCCGVAAVCQTPVTPVNLPVVPFANAVKTKAGIAKEEEARKARILFVIVVLFIICNLLRMVLNVEEVLSMRSYQTAAKEGCNSVPLWAILVNIVSQLLLTLNASSGVFVYCVMSKDFRTELVNLLDLCRRRTHSTRAEGRPGIPRRSRRASTTRMEEKRAHSELIINRNPKDNCHTRMEVEESMAMEEDKLSESKPSLGSSNSVVTTTIALPKNAWRITSNLTDTTTTLTMASSKVVLRSDSDVDAIDDLQALAAAELAVDADAELVDAMSMAAVEVYERDNVA